MKNPQLYWGLSVLSCISKESFLDLILSERALDHVARPRNAGEMTDGHSLGTAGHPGEGAYVRIWLRFSEGRIQKASYETNGCPSSVASASALCELAIGREVAKIKLLEPSDIVLFLGGLPEGKEYYADLAVEALCDAIKECN